MGSISATFTARLCLQSINHVGERWHYGDPMNGCFDCRKYHGNDGQMVGKFALQQVKKRPLLTRSYWKLYFTWKECGILGNFNAPYCRENSSYTSMQIWIFVCEFDAKIFVVHQNIFEKQQIYGQIYWNIIPQ